ncbi:peptidylprolyl isomerase [Comamonas piscis]|uniref:peptidylprolyl isomerase n=1 Tax=Comamonas piscis TaxID=1562974 RepID=A0A7G5EMZ6_9BURK|nr:peptidylprolyl isomerase [Comamonas piscis]QMV75371.1 peptidylprolyl isomerase [Comamonas piscis]WSO33871.1 peptidylprolyl isomerase [Comamonas piscis]
MRSWLTSLGVVTVLATSSVAVMAQATDPVLIEGHGVAVRESDILSDATRLPPEMRASFLARKDSVAQMADAIYIRRVLAQRAKEAQLDKQPETAAAERIASDKVLSDAYWAKIDKDRAPDMKLVDAQVKAAYQVNKDKYQAPEQAHVAHILIANKDEAKAKEQIEKLRQEAASGADFAKLAKDNSSDSNSALKGGDLGPIPRGQTAPEFEAAAFALNKPGELSPVIKTQFGYHIIKLIEKKPARTMSLEEVKPQLEKQFLQEASQKARRAEVENIHEKTKTEPANLEALSAKFAAQK